MTAVLGLFAKAPLPGHAKTRLGERIGMKRAASIYERLLRLQLRQMGGSLSGWRRVVFAAEPEHREWFEAHAGGWQIRTQASGDLGDRLRAAFEWAFDSGADRAIMIGADVPDLRPAHALEAEGMLADHDLALGPSPDGGYYLIGQRPPGAELFHDIAWGSAKVFNRTMRMARTLGLRVYLLEELYDIDRLEDWRRHLAERSLKANEPTSGLVSTDSTSGD
ncbi:MAG: TIGR04282 family arsenosugar biosynthesis glycosyltransferase [Anaerolineales bacterium]|nr:TIGR04282 family arsenosugar biosynthesis glycosyltransferase [Anaerolineales bacterium]